MFCSSISTSTGRLAARATEAIASGPSMAKARSSDWTASAMLRRIASRSAV